MSRHPHAPFLPNRHNSSPPINNMDEFPALAGPSNVNQQQKETLTFKKYVTIKHTDRNIRMTDLSPFAIKEGLKSAIGKKRCNITRLRSGLLLIEVDQKQQYTQLMRLKRIQDIPVIVEEHRTLNISKGVLYCDALRNMSDEQIKMRLTDQDVIEVYRIKRKRNDREEPTDSFIVTFSKPIVPKEIEIGYLKVKVSVYIPKPRICFKCQRYGHGQNTCTHSTICARCGTEGHEYSECVEDFNCYHCKQAHPCNSRECPMWLLEKLIIEQKFTSNITFTEARNRVYMSNPHLTQHIPRIRDQKTPKQYTTVTAQHPSSIHPDMQQFFLQQQRQIALLTSQINTLLALLNEKQNHQSETNSSQEQPQNNSQNENQPQQQPQSNDQMETETDVQGIKRSNRSVSSNEDSDSLVSIDTPNLARDSSIKRARAAALSPNQEDPSSGKGQTSPANLSTPDNNTPSGSGENNPIIADVSNAVDSDSGKSTDGESDSALNTGKQEVPANNSNRGPRTQSLDRNAGFSRQRSRSPLGQKKSKDKKSKVKGGAKLSPKNIFQRNYEKIIGPK